MPNPPPKDEVSPGGLITTAFGGDYTIVYHSNDDFARLETVLTAVVAWRRGTATTAGWRARLRRWQCRLGLDPLSRNFSIGRDAGLWYGSGGRNGEHLTLIHPRLRVARVLGRDYPLAPPGMTLVLLIDETGSSPVVRELRIPAPRISRTAQQLDPAAGAVRRAALRNDPKVWNAALRAHAEIAEFLGGAGE